MSREDREVISMVAENRRRSQITRTVGYIVPEREAHEIAVQRARAAQNESDGISGIVLTMLAIGLILGLVAAIL